MAGNFVPYGRIRLGWRTSVASLACLAAIVGPSPTQNAIADGGTRTLTLYHAHTQENITVTFRRSGSYDNGALQKLNWFLRDWRRDEPTNMDPRLFDVLWETWRETGSGSAIRVVSAYRSPSTNGMLRRRSRAVAKNSQHMLGKAMDFHIPDVSMARVREIGMRLQRGGVGYYPSAGTPFVHLDAGSVRSWPRMPRQQLERLFPDGMTVHLPADGTPLRNYEAALAMIQSRGGSAFSYADVTSPRRSLWAMLFGGEDGEIEEAAPRGRGGRAVAARGGRSTQQVASLSSGGDSASVYAIGGAQSVPEPAAPAIAAAPPPGRGGALRAKPAPLDEEGAKAAPAPTAVASLTPGAQDKSQDKTNYKVALVPLPPRKPSGLKEDAAKAEALLASATQGQARPTAFAETTTGIGNQALPGAITSGSSAPDPAKVYKVAAVPAPPVRPMQLARATVPEIPKAAVALPASVKAAKSDAARLDALMASVVTGSVKDSRPDKVPMPTVRQSVRSGVVASRLGESEPASAGRFTRGIITHPLDARLIKRGAASDED